MKTRFVFIFLLALIGFEIALRVNASISVAIKLRAISNTLGIAKKPYTIMILADMSKGDPQYSWSRQLETMLNEKNSGVRFSVIPSRTNAFTTTALLANLEEDIAKHHPDLIVTMMGMYDPYNPHLPSSTDIFFPIQKRQRTIVEKIKIVHWLLLQFNKLRTHFIAIGNHLSHGIVYATHKTPEQFIELARQYVNQGKYEEATHIIHDAVIHIETTQTPSEATYLSMAEILRRMGKSDEALDLLIKAQKLEPQSSSPYFLMGLVRLDRGELDEAIAMYTRALAANPTDAYLLVELGKIYRLKKNYRDAQIWINKALTMKPTLIHARFWLGVVYREMGKVDEAQQILRSLIELPEGPAKQFYSQAKTSEASNHFKEAEELYQKAIEQSPTDGRTYLGLGYLSHRLGHFDKAQALFQKAAELDPDLTKPAMPYTELSYIYRQLGKLNEAEDLEHRAGEQNALTPRNYLHLQEVTRQSGVKLVVLGYPFRTNRTLESLFESEDDVLLVSLESVFPETSEKRSSPYFEDNDFGDFGTLTREGNKRIAQFISINILP